MFCLRPPYFTIIVDTSSDNQVSSQQASHNGWEEDGGVNIELALHSAVVSLNIPWQWKFDVDRKRNGVKRGILAAWGQDKYSNYRLRVTSSFTEQSPSGRGSLYIFLEKCFKKYRKSNEGPKKGLT